MAKHVFFEVAAARQEMEGQWELDRRRVEWEIGQERLLAQFRREQMSEEQELRNRLQIGTARTVKTVAGIEGEQDDQDVRKALDWSRENKKIKREDKIALNQAELEQEEQRLRMALDEERQRLDLRLQESRQLHSQDLERIESLSTAGIETLIAVSGPEQAGMLAELARTRALAGCSPQQILAMQAESSPQIADALRQILTATAADGQLAQYERLIDEIKENARTGREDHRQNIATMTEMFNKALDSVKDTAVAFSSRVNVTGLATAPQQPDLRRHAAPDGTVTLMFSDIEGSTAMTIRLGDAAAQNVLKDHNAIFRQQVDAFDGFEVKSMGDGFMLAFSSGHNALDCAVAVQRSFAAYNDQHPAEPLNVRMGLHAGDAIKEGDDFFGKNVILAARISAKAHGGEILVSSLFKEITQSGTEIRFGEAQEVELKGLAGTARIYPVIWE